MGEKRGRKEFGKGGRGEEGWTGRRVENVNANYISISLRRGWLT